MPDDETRAGRVTVLEPAIYSPDSPNSYFADLMALVNPTDSKFESASERMERYGKGLQHDANKPEGRRAARVLREVRRTGAEVRAGGMTSAAASGGAFVTPEYLTTNYAPWREYVPSVAEACTKTDLPEFGMTVNVPAITAADPTSIQNAELAAAETDVTGAYRTAALDTWFGTTTISQQLYDRSGPTAFDQVIFAQLRGSLDQKVDLAVINAITAAVPGANQLTRATFTDMSSIWSDVNHAAALLESTTGVVLPATHAFFPPIRLRWFASQVDTQKRPIWQPDGTLPPQPEIGFSGYRIASTGVYSDGSIPASGANDVMIVANPAATLLPMGEPVAQVMPETFAGTLGVTVRLYCYGVPVVRYPAAAATITGNAYPTAVTWA